MTPREAYEQAFNYGWLQELEDVVVNSGLPGIAFYFARDIRGANIKRLEDVVIEAGISTWAYFFATQVKGANIKDLVDYVLVQDPSRIKFIFEWHPELKQQYELDEIRSIVRKALK